MCDFDKIPKSFRRLSLFMVHGSWNPTITNLKDQTAFHWTQPAGVLVFPWFSQSPCPILWAFSAKYDTESFLDLHLFLSTRRLKRPDHSMDVEEISASSATARARSVLNPDAAPYVPASQRSVEDFSPEWWALVQFSPRFVHYWLRECFHDEGEIEDHDLPDDISDALLSFSTALDRNRRASSLMFLFRAG